MKKTRGRDKQGLTPKMRESIPIISESDTIHAGVIKCVEQGIINDKGYFYRHGGWNEDEPYRTVLDAAIEKYRGTKSARAQQRVFLYLDAIVDRLIKNALEGRERSIEDCLQIAGIEVGRAAKVDVSIVTKLNTHRESYKQRAIEALTATGHPRFMGSGNGGSDPEPSGN
jgi:hypothetical protein